MSPHAQKTDHLYHLLFCLVTSVDYKRNQWIINQNQTFCSGIRASHPALSPVFALWLLRSWLLSAVTLSGDSMSVFAASPAPAHGYDQHRN